MQHRHLKLAALDLLQNKRLMEARQRFEEFLKYQPTDADAWHILSGVNGLLGLFGESESCARKAVELQPASASAWNNLGSALLAQNKSDQAIAAFVTSLDIAPDSAETHNHLGNCHLKKQSYHSALEAYKNALSLKPDYAEAQNHMGIALLSLHQPERALPCFQSALKLNPGYIDAMFNLGKTRQELGQAEIAHTIYSSIISSCPDHFEARFGLGDLMLDNGDLAGASDCYKQLLATTPDHPGVQGALAGVLKDTCDQKKATALYKQAVANAPDDNGLYSNYLMSLNYMENADLHSVSKEHKTWGEIIGNRLPARYDVSARSHTEIITLGFVSHDFRTHSVAYFFEPLLEHLDKNKFTVICYSNMGKRLEDSTTNRIRNLCDKWVDITGLSDRQAADIIFNEKTDILIDLAGHTAWNRLPIFAYKPAPVQITYLGYPNTTGLSTIDYRLTDIFADPGNGNESLYTEKLLRIDGGFLTYRAPETAPEPGEPPFKNSGVITFGSFNTLAKVGDNLISAWGDILDAVPDTRLLLKNSSFRCPVTRRRFKDKFVSRGIDSNRIQLIPPLAGVNEHLSLYREIDIALDTFPYNGTTTSCEALWMGVPVITRAGDVHAARVGHSILSQLGLEDFIATDAQDYVHIASQLARDHDRITQLRQTLRSLFNGANLGNPARFTRSLEKSLDTIWSADLSRQKT